VYVAAVAARGRGEGKNKNICCYVAVPSAGSAWAEGMNKKKTLRERYRDATRSLPSTEPALVQPLAHKRGHVKVVGVAFTSDKSSPVGGDNGH